MAPVPTISITTPDLENKDMNNMSTITPDSDKDFDVSKDPSADQKEIKITPEETLNDSLEAFYHQKSILLTGATGFIGKAVLWKLLHSLSDSVDKIFILLRPNRLNQNSPERRLREDILSNKVKMPLINLSMTKMYEYIGFY
jgi:FlaA1/EpsC-like NDP-sugar epimerase